MSEFLEFLRKTNALALAVAVIIGTAIGKVVSSVVGDVLMPIVSLFVGGGEWRALQIPLKTAPDGKVLTAIGVGNLLGSVVDFVIIALFVFLIARSLLKEQPTLPGPRMSGVRRERSRGGHPLQILFERGVNGVSTMRARAVLVLARSRETTMIAGVLVGGWSRRRAGHVHAEARGSRQWMNARPDPRDRYPRLHPGRDSLADGLRPQSDRGHHPLGHRRKLIGFARVLVVRSLKYPFDQTVATYIGTASS